jgi:hypothetical protein
VPAAVQTQERFAVNDLYDSAIVQAIVQSPRYGAEVVRDRPSARNVRRGDSHNCGVVYSGWNGC